MTHHLKPEQIEALRGTPLGSMPNRLEVALAMAQAKQSDIVAAYPDALTHPTVSRIINGRVSRVDVQLCHLFADFFGCQIEDLFPARDEAHAS